VSGRLWNIASGEQLPGDESERQGVLNDGEGVVWGVLQQVEAQVVQVQEAREHPEQVAEEPQLPAWAQDRNRRQE
jgi:hypothetical protein